ncbi:MAG: YceI family protein [Roseiflexaceae bacterium]|nr:YceI family protein [Roseiflexaceae bacterium]
MSWNADYGHSVVEFSARHMMLAKTRGQFEKFTVTVDADEANPANSSVEVQIDAASLNTRDANRDGHLKSPDFLDVAKYPYITFKSTGLNLSSQKNATLQGVLTIRDVTKPVTLEVEYHGQSKSPWGTTNAGFTASTKISRSDWELTWNVALETGGVLVSDEITINIELELVKQAVTAPAEEVAA